MEKKKIITMGITILVVVLVVTLIAILCIKPRTTEEKVDIKPLNESIVLEDVFRQIKELENVDGAENIIERENKGEEEIDFGKYRSLEKKALVYTNDSIVNEVWMIKLGSYEQQEEVCRILGNRLQKLKAGFAENQEQSSILQKAVIKQEDGIVIMIISPQTEEIEETISVAMRK